MATKWDDMEDDMPENQPAKKERDATIKAFSEMKDDLTEETVTEMLKKKLMVTQFLKEGGKLKKGQPLSAAIWGTVVFRGKVKNHPELIYVEQETGMQAFGATNLNKAGETLRTAVFKIKTNEAFVMPIPKPRKPQGTRLLLARCETCELRIRASSATLQLGSPLCFNDGCKDKGKPLTVETGDQRGEGGAGGGFGIGALDQDMAQVGRDTLQKHNVRKPKKG